ncbi:MAG TPA: S4 domain-containing protein, partial [Candidatus Babeliaceae bacterium]|nr:S4 domain-containing protein [Candidatus Babeliaceae bacterium]
MKTSTFIQPNTCHTVEVPQDHLKGRIDLFLPSYFAAYSRSFFQKLIGDNSIKLNGVTVEKHNTIVKAGDCIEVQFPPLRPIEPSKEITDRLDVEILYEHDHFLIISKPPRLI